jgi:transcriptional regulator with XRE-family HTH domain
MTVRTSDFGGRLRELREAAGLTQGQLAERADLHVQAVVKLERGEREPAWGTVISLCDALAVSCDEFRKQAAALPPRRRGRPPKETTATRPKRGKARKGE